MIDNLGITSAEAQSYVVLLECQKRQLGRQYNRTRNADVLHRYNVCEDLIQRFCSLFGCTRKSKEYKLEVTNENRQLDSTI